MNDDDQLIIAYGEPQSVGAYSTFQPVPADDYPLPREFPIGFHVAAPGPSRERQKRKRAKA